MTHMPSEVIHLFAFESMCDRERALAVAAVNSLQMGSRVIRYRVVTTGASLNPVTTQEGARIQPQVALDAVTPGSSAMLILPGGRRWETRANTKALSLAARFLAQGVPVAAIGAAADALARLAFLDPEGRSEGPREYLISSGYQGSSFYSGLPNHRSDTAAAPVDFAREIFRMLNITPGAGSRAHPAIFPPESAVNHASASQPGSWAF